MDEILWREEVFNLSLNLKIKFWTERSGRVPYNFTDPTVRLRSSSRSDRPYYSLRPGLKLL